MDTIHVLMSPVPPNINIQFEIPLGVNPACDFVVLRNYKMLVLCFKVLLFFFLYVYLSACVGMHTSISCLRGPEDSLWDDVTG